MDFKGSINALNDNELMDLLKSREDTAFNEIYNRYWDKLFIVAYNRLQDRLDAEEVVQNIFASLWKRRQTLQLTYSLATYLSVAVKYQVITTIAKQKREKEYISATAPYAQECVETTADWISEKELKEQIEKCVQMLPAKCKIVFIMSRYDHMTNAEISSALKISEKTVEGHITKALNNLRNSLNISLPLLLLLLKK